MSSSSFRVILRARQCVVRVCAGVHAGQVHACPVVGSAGAGAAPVFMSWCLPRWSGRECSVFEARVLVRQVRVGLGAAVRQGERGARQGVVASGVGCAGSPRRSGPACSVIGLGVGAALVSGSRRCLGRSGGTCVGDRLGYTLVRPGGLWVLRVGFILAFGPGVLVIGRGGAHQPCQGRVASAECTSSVNNSS